MTVSATYRPVQSLSLSPSHSQPHHDRVRCEASPLKSASDGCDCRPQIGQLWRQLGAPWESSEVF
jgi:hypothetical protein